MTDQPTTKPAPIKQNYLMIDGDGVVQNCIVWDGVALYEPPVGWTLVPVDEGEYYEFGKPRGVTPPAVVVTSKPT
jgi:hypothetical protein